LFVPLVLSTLESIVTGSNIRFDLISNKPRLSLMQSEGNTRVVVLVWKLSNSDGQGIGSVPE